MGPISIPVFTDCKLPKVCDTVIIGGGVIGVCAAMFLAERGQDVVLVEKGHIAGEQSSRNWGWCRQCRRDPREFDLVRESLRLWRGMNEFIGADTGFAACGTFFAARDDETVAKYTQWVRDAAQADIYAEIIDKKRISALLPGDIAPPSVGMYCQSDGRAEPQLAVPRMAMSAISRGAKIIVDCAARGIETAAGRVVSVVTERGVVRCEQVVVAGGVWTRRILRDLDVHIPQLRVRGTVSRTQPLEGGPNISFWDDILGIRRRFDGSYTLANGVSNTVPLTPDSFRFFRAYLPLLAMEWRHLRLVIGKDFFTEWANESRVPLDKPSPYETCRVLDPRPDLGAVIHTLSTFRERFPALSHARLVQVWAGMIDAMPDAVPIISPVCGTAGLVVATGFSGHGFGIGPGAGHLVADLVTGSRPIADPHEFRLSRYTDGSMPPPSFGV